RVLRRLHACYIRSRGINLIAVARHSPLHASIRSTLAHSQLPQDLAFAIWIESVDHSGLLTSEQDVEPVVGLFENHGRHIVEVRARAIVLCATCRIREIVGCLLLRLIVLYIYTL